MVNINNIRLKAGLEYSRNLSGLNKIELAKTLNISPATYYRKENDPLTFTLRELLKLKLTFKTETIEEIFLPRGVIENANGNKIK